MRTSPWCSAAVGFAILLAGTSIQAQSPMAPGTPPTLAVPPPVVPDSPAVHQTIPQDVMPHYVSDSPEEVGEGGASAGSFFAFGEALALKARRSAHNFAISDPTLNSSIDGSFQSMDWNWSFTYRLGAGYKLHDGWEADGVYTYVHAKDDRTVLAPAGGALYATLTNPSIDQVNSARASSNLDYDVIDLELAKRFDANDRLEIRLAGGARIASIQQKFNVAYDATPLGAGQVLVNSPISFDGIGIRVGGEGYWHILGGLRAYAKMYGSLVSGELRSSLRETINNGSQTTINVTEHTDRMIPVAEMGIGLAYITDHLQVKFGYEMTNWFNLIDSVDFVDGNSFGKTQRRQGDLSLEGLALQIGVMF